MYLCIIYIYLNIIKDEKKVTFKLKSNIHNIYIKRIKFKICKRAFLNYCFYIFILFVSLTIFFYINKLIIVQIAICYNLQIKLY